MDPPSCQKTTPLYPQLYMNYPHKSPSPNIVGLKKYCPTMAAAPQRSARLPRSAHGARHQRPDQNVNPTTTWLLVHLLSVDRVLLLLIGGQELKTKGSSSLSFLNRKLSIENCSYQLSNFRYLQVPPVPAEVSSSPGSSCCRGQDPTPRQPPVVCSGGRLAAYPLT